MFQNRDIYIVGNGKAGSWLFNQLLVRNLIQKDKFLPGRSPKLPILSSNIVVFFIAVPDKYIESTAKQYKALLPNNIDCWFVHLSGSKASSLLSSETNMPSASFHPAFSIPSRSDIEIGIFPTIAIEGDLIVAKWLTNLAIELGFEPINILEENKNLYHAACVIAGSLNSLYYQKLCNLFLHSGITSDQSKSIVKNLINTSIHNVDKFGLEKGLTGPIARNDIATQDSNLEALSAHDEVMAELYKVLCKLLPKAN